MTLDKECNVCGKTDCRWILMSPEYFGKKLYIKGEK